MARSGSAAAIVEPTTTLAIGAATTLYSAIRLVSAGAFGDVLGDDLVVHRIAPVEVAVSRGRARVDVGDEAALRRGAGDDLAVDDAVHRPVGVAGDDDSISSSMRLDDRREGTGRPVRSIDRASTLMSAVATRDRTLPPSWSSTTMASTPWRLRREQGR